jgi:hypothetical protein
VLFAEVKIAKSFEKFQKSFAQSGTCDIVPGQSDYCSVQLSIFRRQSRVKAVHSGLAKPDHMLRIVTFECDSVMPGVDGRAGIAPRHMGCGHDGHSVESGSTGSASRRPVAPRGHLRHGRDAGPDSRTMRCLKPSSSFAAELDRDAFRTDPHDMCPRWFGCGWIWRPKREQRTQGVDGNEIDAAQVDDQYAAVPHQPSGVRAHVVYIGRVDLAADGDYREFGIVADPNTGSAAIDDCCAVSTWRMVNVIVPSSHVQAFAGAA